MPIYPDVWLFDENRRVYRRDCNGRSVGPPIWREHWSKRNIIGETSRSWIVSDGSRNGRRIPKTGGRGIAFSEADIDRQAFVEENRHKIAEQVRSIRDYDTLKAVYDLVMADKRGV